MSTTYEMMWLGKYIGPPPDNLTMDALIQSYEQAIVNLKEMKADGITIDPSVSKRGTYFMVTNDPEVAEKHAMYDANDVPASEDELDDLDDDDDDEYEDDEEWGDLDEDEDEDDSELV